MEIAPFIKNIKIKAGVKSITEANTAPARIFHINHQNSEEQRQLA